MKRDVLAGLTEDEARIVALALAAWVADGTDAKCAKMTSLDQERDLDVAESILGRLALADAAENAECPKFEIDRTKVNDALSDILGQAGVDLDDDNLNELTHYVADFIVERGTASEDLATDWLANELNNEFGAAMTPEQAARAGAALARMRAAGCALSKEDVETLARGDEPECSTKYAMVDGFDDLQALLDEIVDGETS